MMDIFKNKYMVEDKFTKKTESWSIKYQENGKEVIDTFQVEILKNIALIEKLNIIYGY